MSETTHRISRDELKDLPVLAEGYKIFNEDWKCIDYCYADENGTAVGTVHKIECELMICRNGFHFCEKLEDCFNYYYPIKFNKIAKVRAYGEVIDECDKSCCSIIEIVEELHWDDIHIKMVDDSMKIDDSKYRGIHDVYTSIYVCGSNNVNHSVDIYGSNDTSNSIDVTGGYDIINSQSIRGCTNIRSAHNVYGSYNINKSLDIQGSTYVENSCYVHGCRTVRDSHTIYGSNEIYYSQDIWGGYLIYFSANLKGAYNCMFCIGLNGTKYRIFNKKVSKAYFNQVYRDICEILHYTRYHMTATNYEELYEKYRNVVPINRLQSKHLDYSEMPQQLLDYIKNLPEYDEKIFNKIINYNLTNMTD